MDGTTYTGYYISLYFQTAMGVGFLVLFSMFIQLQTGFCDYMDTCTEDFKLIFHRMSDHVATKYKSNEIRTHDTEIKESIKESVLLHAEMLK